MIRHIKIIALGALLAAMAATALLNKIAISWYPPIWELPDGRWGYFAPSDIRSCIHTTSGPAVMRRPNRPET